MRQIDNQFNTNTVGYGWSGNKSVDFVQANIADGVSGIVESLLGAAYDPTKSYIMKGCVLTSTGGMTSISAGTIYGISKALGSMTARTYLYAVAAQTFTDPTGGNVVVGTVSKISAGYDPVNFSDGSTHSIHNEWRVVFGTGASGSADVNYGDLLNFTHKIANAADNTNFDNTTFQVKTGKDPITGLVTVFGEPLFIGATPSAPSIVLCTLPTGYRPLSNIHATANIYRSGGPSIDPGAVTIATNGEVRMLPSVSFGGADRVLIGGISFLTT